MGKGDKRTKRGKIFKSSYGNTRPQGSKANADKKAAELKRLGIDEFFIISEDGPNKFAISLGVFKNEEGAKNYLEILAKQGVKTACAAERETRVAKTIFTLRGVDDVKSRYYNQIVDETTVPDKDWDSAEIMRREDGLYGMGVMIGHNPERVAGGGSCIFLHVWKGPGQGTAGCTALEAENVRKIIAWLDPGMAPRLVLGVPGQ